MVSLLMFLFSGISLAATHITFGTGSPGGTYYPLGGAMADLWTQLLKAEGIEVTTESTAASRREALPPANISVYGYLISTVRSLSDN